MKWGCSPNPSSRHRFFLLTRSSQYPNQLKAAHGNSITVLILVLSKVPCLLVVCASPPGRAVGTYCDIPELRIYFRCRSTYNWVRPPSDTYRTSTQSFFELFSCNDSDVRHWQTPSESMQWYHDGKGGNIAKWNAYCSKMIAFVCWQNDCARPAHMYNWRPCWTPSVASLMPISATAITAAR